MYNHRNRTKWNQIQPTHISRCTIDQLNGPACNSNWRNWKFHTEIIHAVFESSSKTPAISSGLPFLASQTHNHSLEPSWLYALIYIYILNCQVEIWKLYNRIVYEKSNVDGLRGVLLFDFISGISLFCKKFGSNSFKINHSFFAEITAGQWLSWPCGIYFLFGWKFIKPIAYFDNSIWR